MGVNTVAVVRVCCGRCYPAQKKQSRWGRDRGERVNERDITIGWAKADLRSDSHIIHSLLSCVILIKLKGVFLY
jgi:hypothetical protein